MSIPISTVAVLAGIACLLAAVLLLRRVGSGYRIARILAAAPAVTLAEVVEIASAGAAERSYVRTTGRISSDEEFPDEHQRPLVFRRQRVERRKAGRGSWQVLSENRLAVPFGIEDRSTLIAVDVDALGEGLVVIPREATGAYSELPADFRPADSESVDPATAVRVRIDQVSAVEHATVCGVPSAGPDGPMLTAGLDRPLVLSTLEQPAAMRLLAGRSRTSVQAAALALVAGLGFAAIGVVALLVGR